MKQWQKDKVHAYVKIDESSNKVWNEYIGEKYVCEAPTEDKIQKNAIY